MVGVGMSGDDQLAGREAEVHLPDQFQHVGEFVEEADVDQGVLPAAVDQVDIDPHPAPGLVVHLDHAGEEVVPLDHGCERLLGLPAPTLDTRREGKWNRSSSYSQPTERLNDKDRWLNSGTNRAPETSKLPQGWGPGSGRACTQ